MSKTLRTPKVRISFPQLFEPKAMDDKSTPKYSAMFIFSEEAQQTPEFKALIEEIDAVSKEKWPRGLPKGFKSPVKKGSEMVSAKGERYSGINDTDIVIKAQSTYRPGVIGRDKQPITNPADVYAGCYVLATLTPAIFDMPTSKGATIYLANIMKIADGTPLAGRRAAASEFEDIEISVEETDSVDF